jgi:hypothetical protein
VVKCFDELVDDIEVRDVVICQGNTFDGLDFLIPGRQHVIADNHEGREELLLRPFVVEHTRLADFFIKSDAREIKQFSVGVVAAS